MDRRYLWLKEACERIDRIRDTLHWPYMELVLTPQGITVHGRVLGTDHNLNQQVTWTEFEAARINVLMEAIERIQNSLKKHLPKNR
jgi:hypothetical protein